MVLARTIGLTPECSTPEDDHGRSRQALLLSERDYKRLRLSGLGGTAPSQEARSGGLGCLPLGGGLVLLLEILHRLACHQAEHGGDGNAK